MQWNLCRKGVLILTLQQCGNAKDNVENAQQGLELLHDNKLDDVGCAK